MRGKYFEHLTREEKTTFWRYQFPIEYLPANDETIIDTIFERINRNTARLTRQELRHARYGGHFITAAEELPDYGFPRIESQSRKQMKDVELVANLLLFLEEGIRGYSQDELDEAFSDRETAWEDAATIRTRFVETVKFKTRLRNQADFYSLFTAVSESVAAGEIDCARDEFATRLSEFVASVEDDQRRGGSRPASDYFRAARSNSNDSGPRKKRHEIIRKALENSLHDYAGADTEQVLVG